MTDIVLFDPACQTWIPPHALAPGLDPLAGGDGLRLRRWRLSDAPVLARLLDDDSLWQHMPEPRPARIDPETARLLIAAAATVPGTETRAVLIDQAPVGQIRLVLGPRSAELSYWLGRAYRGQGLGRAMVAAAVARVFAQCPHLTELTARVRPDNAPSRAVLAAAGFTEVRHHDGWLWLRLRGSAATSRRN